MDETFRLSFFYGFVLGTGTAREIFDRCQYATEILLKVVRIQRTPSRSFSVDSLVVRVTLLSRLRVDPKGETEIGV